MTVVPPVPPPAAADPPDTTASYRRRARHLRWRHRGDSSRMIRALRDLGHPGIQIARPPRSQAPAATFSTIVEQALRQAQGSLRYSKRIELLQEADAMGLNRFEANLIIAVCCHRHPGPPAEPSIRGRWLQTVALVALIQGGILWATYSLLL